MSKWARPKPPPGFDYIKPTLDALEQELRDKVNEPHEGKRKTESQWPIHQINWQRSRYVFDMFYRYKKISKEVFDYCVRHKLIDGPLCSKWRKPGYERLCSTYVINTSNYNFGSVSICRVPRIGPVECPTTGCRGCASGTGGNIFGNKYGQYLAGIQIKREKLETRDDGPWDDDEPPAKRHRGDDEEHPAPDDEDERPAPDDEDDEEEGPPLPPEEHSDAA